MCRSTAAPTSFGPEGSRHSEASQLALIFMLSEPIWEGGGRCVCVGVGLAVCVGGRDVENPGEKLVCVYEERVHGG